MSDDPNELLDVVDEQDRVMGQTKRGAFTKKDNGRLRGSCVLLQDDKKRLWVPTRVATKHIAPNGLDSSAAEHAKAGESYESAAIRGMHEELNIAADAAKLTLIGKLPLNTTPPYFISWYTYPFSGEPDFNTNDFCEGRWMTIDEIRQELQNRPSKDALREAIKQLF